MSQRETQQLQIIPERLTPCLSSMLFTLLSDAKYEGNMWLKSKYCLPNDIASHKYKYNKALGLVICLEDVIILETATNIIQSLYKEVLGMNELINPVTIKKEL